MAGILIKRLKEPSTWAGVAVLSAVFGMNPATIAAIGHLAALVVPFVPVDGGVLAQLVIGAAGGLAMALPETKHTAQAGE